MKRSGFKNSFKRKNKNFDVEIIIDQEEMRARAFVNPDNIQKRFHRNNENLLCGDENTWCVINFESSSNKTSIECNQPKFLLSTKNSTSILPQINLLNFYPSLKNTINIDGEIYLDVDENLYIKFKTKKNIYLENFYSFEKFKEGLTKVYCVKTNNLFEQYKLMLNEEEENLFLDDCKIYIYLGKKTSKYRLVLNFSGLIKNGFFKTIIDRNISVSLAETKKTLSTPRQSKNSNLESTKIKESKLSIVAKDDLNSSARNSSTKNKISVTKSKINDDEKLLDTEFSNYNIGYEIFYRIIHGMQFGNEAEDDNNKNFDYSTMEGDFSKDEKSKSSLNDVTKSQNSLKRKKNSKNHASTNFQDLSYEDVINNRIAMPSFDELFSVSKMGLLDFIDVCDANYSINKLSNGIVPIQKK